MFVYKSYLKRYLIRQADQTPMRIALVSPKWNELVNSYPPLGLGYLAAVLENEGHSVSIFDLGLDPDGSLEDGADAIASCSPDIVGITAMTNNYHSASKTCALLKARTGCPVVVGGPQADNGMILQRKTRGDVGRVVGPVVLPDTGSPGPANPEHELWSFWWPLVDQQRIPRGRDREVQLAQPGRSSRRHPERGIRL